MGSPYLVGHFLVLTLGARLFGRQREARRQSSASHGSASTAPSAAAGRPRVLVVFPFRIYPPTHGGAVRIFNLLKSLRQSADVYLLVLSDAVEDAAQRAGLEAVCEKVFFHPWQRRHWPDRWHLLPKGAQLFNQPLLAERIESLVEAHGIDIVQFDYSELGVLKRTYRRARSSLVEHDIAFRSAARRRKTGIYRRYADADADAFGGGFYDWMRLLRHEVLSCREVALVQTMSLDDSLFLQRYLPRSTPPPIVVPNGVAVDDFEASTDSTKRQGVLFVGSFPHLPNRDALEFFLERIWPLIRERRPDERLTIVGSAPSKDILALDADPAIDVVGEVADIRPEYWRHRVLVVPLRAGSGTRLKILEGFAAGIPVVTTSIGAEGIRADGDPPFLVHDDPEAFAASVCNVLDDESIMHELQHRGRQVAVEYYSWVKVGEDLARGYAAALSPRDESPLEYTPSCTMARPLAPLAPEVSVIIPVFNGMATLPTMLERCRGQDAPFEFEVLCIDSGSSDGSQDAVRRAGARLIEIPKGSFNHGRTRDLGASMARGRALVFVNQDSLPGNDQWLAALAAPLLEENGPPVVQGAIHEIPEQNERFYWDCNGPRFYFTRESETWIREFAGVGFSTVNAGMRRDFWEKYPFGPSDILEDKKFQRQIMELGHGIVEAPDSIVQHTHFYTLRQLVARCLSEGYGWRRLGVRYSSWDAVRDVCQRHLWTDWLEGVRSRRIRTGTELGFPLLRPLFLMLGSRFARRSRC